MELSRALQHAQDLDMDLVEVAPNVEPPVCKVMDYGKYKYEQDVKEKEARKKQQHVKVREIRFKPKISRHDFETKRRHVERFLNEGSKVKVAVWFRGREMAHTELGMKLLDVLAEEVQEVGTVETPAKLDGRNMIMVLSPVKKEKK
jgi:translation initiation factor IF-3